MLRRGRESEDSGTDDPCVDLKDNEQAVGSSREIDLDFLFYIRAHLVHTKTKKASERKPVKP